MPATTNPEKKLPTPSLENLRTLRPAIHPNCVVCSPTHPFGLHMNFRVTEDSKLAATFDCSQRFEGYTDRLQGGVVSSLMDGIMANCMFACGIPAVTAELATRFRHPVKTDVPAELIAEIVSESHGIYFLKAKLIQEGQLRATAKGKFIEMPKNQANQL